MAIDLVRIDLIKGSRNELRCTQDLLVSIPKRDGSWDHTLPVKNTHCKISSLELRRSAILQCVSLCLSCLMVLVCTCEMCNTL